MSRRLSLRKQSASGTRHSLFVLLKKVPEKCYNDKEMWPLFIAKNDEEVIDMLANENQDIKKAVEKLEYVSSDRDERFRIDQGIEEGIELEKQEMAKSLLQMLDDDQISRVTKLSIEEIGRIRRDN